eukprot:661374-Pelagomonas_calceolata.AAC.3
MSGLEHQHKSRRLCADAPFPRSRHITPAMQPVFGIQVSPMLDMQTSLSACRYHECLAPALRAGCLVISYDTCLSIPGCSMEDECEAVLAEAKQWAREQGLLETADDSLTVQ